MQIFLDGLDDLAGGFALVWCVGHFKCFVCSLLCCGVLCQCSLRLLYCYWGCRRCSGLGLLFRFVLVHDIIAWCESVLCDVVWEIYAGM